MYDWYIFEETFGWLMPKLEARDLGKELVSTVGDSSVSLWGKVRPRIGEEKGRMTRTLNRGIEEFQGESSLGKFLYLIFQKIRHITTHQILQCYHETFGLIDLPW